MDTRHTGVPGAPDLAISRQQEAEARYRLGAVCVDSSRVRRGLRQLRLARGEFESMGDESRVLDCLSWETRGLCLLQAPDAYRVGQQALERSRAMGSAGRPAQARVHGYLGTFYALDHRWHLALHHLRKSLAIGGPAAQVAEVLTMLAFVMVGLGRPELAIACCRLPDVRDIAASDLMLAGLVAWVAGRLTLQAGDPYAATGYLECAVEWYARSNTVHGRGMLVLDLAGVAIDLGMLEAAERCVVDAAELATHLGEPITLAVCHDLCGRLAAARGNVTMARGCFRRALHLLALGGAEQRLRECHARFGLVLESAGDARGALRHWKLAAQPPPATRWRSGIV